jgi:CheY-like chemotaxis protein
MKHVLIIDDVATNLLILETLLRKSGCEVYTFINPEDCIQWARNNISLIDLAIIDFQMPSMAGDALAAQLRELGCGFNIVILTAHSALSKDMLDPGAKITTIINKPISINDIQYILNRWSHGKLPIDVRREPRISVSSEDFHEIYCYQNGFYQSFHANCINRSDSGLAYRLRPRDMGIIVTGNEILLDEGLNYSVRWSHLHQGHQCFGLSKIL